MGKDVKTIVQNLAKDLNKKYPDFLGLYLYGSTAKDKARENSDIDIVALFKNEVSKEKKFSIYDILMEIEYKAGVLFDFHPMTQKELERNPMYLNEVLKGVYYEGC